MTRGTGKPSNMVHVSFFALFAVCQLAFAYACTPAVIWCSHDSSDYDAMYRTMPSSPKLTSDEFKMILSQLNVTEPAIVAEELCVEDLRNSKVLSNATNGSKIFYFPCVLSDESFQKIYKQIIIEDINDHEFNMILKDIDSSGCIALTGKQCRYSYTERIKREALADNSTSEFKIKTDNVLLYSAQPLILKISDKPEVQLVQSKVVDMSSRKGNESRVTILTIKLTDQTIGSVTLEFFFEVKSVGYYTLNKVNCETTNGVDNLSTNRDISFSFGFSYHCSPKTIFTDGTTFLSITDMQVQVDYKDATFSDAYDCVGFTSIPIWTGIFVTVILGLIMIWALTMIMDIRTMDRFDDPKGKTITISSAE
ncbi:V-type proton ATPase subunit S1 [Trachymyrmex septentrionalis]|uniref:V-type proton ATPase subunit S1 n=1 Tax=Trachymyrmex septentrionalis TaxID=34720 RepID=A0A195EY51_9HYME|nr:PREDICTED: uncharacterized protein LOC108753770 [Trachymyrmex septentrionalis]KYN33210.1 V-type proton ATPase subunit S1 [Trachymyrmex septentrionalis]